MTQTYVQHVSPTARTEEIGFIITEGSTGPADTLVIGADLGFIFKILRVDVAGDLAVKGKGGNTIFFTNVVPGESIPVEGTGILAGTTATGVRWYGGI